MTPSDYNLLATQRPEGLDDAAYLAWLAENVITLATEPVIVTYQTIRATLAGIDPNTAKAKCNAIAAVVAAADPIGNQLLFGVGVNVNFADAQALLAALPTATANVPAPLMPVTVADCDALRNLGRTVAARWAKLGLSALPLQADLDQLARIAAAQALQQAVEDRYKAATATLNPLIARVQAGATDVVWPTVDDLLAGGG